MKLFRSSQLEIIIWFFQSFQKSGCKSKVFPDAINHIGAMEVRYHVFLARDSKGVIGFKYRPLSPEERDMVPVIIIIILLIIMEFISYNAWGYLPIKPGLSRSWPIMSTVQKCGWLQNVCLETVKKEDFQILSVLEPWVS